MVTYSTQQLHLEVIITGAIATKAAAGVALVADTDVGPVSVVAVCVCVTVMTWHSTLIYICN